MQTEFHNFYNRCKWSTSGNRQVDTCKVYILNYITSIIYVNIKYFAIISYVRMYMWTYIGDDNN